MRKNVKKLIALAAAFICALMITGCGADYFDPQPDSGYKAQRKEAIPEDTITDRKDELALYIHTYGHLPENFITKSRAKKLGWSGGEAEYYSENGCIGGDRFGNYEGILPKGYTYYECDVETLGVESRGSKRLIYTKSGIVYYTEDHYQSFERLYDER